jgi:hypothetical protein
MVNCLATDLISFPREHVYCYLEIGVLSAYCIAMAVLICFKVSAQQRVYMQQYESRTLSLRQPILLLENYH